MLNVEHLLTCTEDMSAVERQRLKSVLIALSRCFSRQVAHLLNPETSLAVVANSYKSDGQNLFICKSVLREFDLLKVEYLAPMLRQLKALKSVQEVC